MKKMIFLALAMVIFSGCDKANSADCPDIRTQEFRDGSVQLHMRARDDISIHNIIINRGNCLYVDYHFFLRNGVDKIQSGKRPLTSDYIETEMRDEDYKEVARKELNAGPKKFVKNIDLKFGEEFNFTVICQPLEVVFETNLGQCEYKFN